MNKLAFFRDTLIISVCFLVMACGESTSDIERRPEGDGSVANVPATAGTLADPKEAREFLNEEAYYLVTQLKMTEMAILKSDNPEVRELARELQNDYKEVRRQLSRLAQISDRDLTIQHAEDQELEKRMKDKTGHEFDKEILDILIETQEKAIERMEAAIAPHHLKTERDKTRVPRVTSDTQEAKRPDSPVNVDNDQVASRGTTKPKVGDELNRLERRPSQRDPAYKDNTPVADGDLAGWIDNTLPVLQDNLERSKEVRSAL